MISAMAAFAVEDTFVKAAAGTLPVGQILIWFGLGGGVVFAVWARISGETLWSIARRYQVSVGQLLSWNKLSIDTPLQLDQILLILD